MLSALSRNRQVGIGRQAFTAEAPGRGELASLGVRSSAGVGAVGGAYARREIVPIRRHHARAQPAIPGDRNRAGLTHARAVFINVIQALQPLVPARTKTG